MLDSDLWIALIILLVTISIGIGYVYFDKVQKFEMYTIGFTTRVGRIFAIWGSLVFGLGLGCGFGFVFSDSRLFFILLPLMTLIGYIVGCGVGSNFLATNMPILIRAIIGFSSLFGTVVFLNLFLQIKNIELTTPNVLIPLVVSAMVATILILFSVKYRRLILIILTISEIILVVCAVVKFV